MRVAPFPDPRSPPASLPRLRPSPYPSQTAPRHLNLRTPPHDYCTKTVPNEIINLVLDMLDDKIVLEAEQEEEEGHDEDRNSDEDDDVPPSIRLETLARCCRVSRAFLPKSRQLLYHTIKYNEHLAWNVEKLLSSKMPHLTALVQAFTITVTTYAHVESLHLGLRTFPNLEILRLRLAAPNPGEILSGVTQCILEERASERLTGFKLDLTAYLWRGLSSDIFGSTLETLLEALPHLTHLSLSGNLPRLVGRPLPFNLVRLSLIESNFDLSRLASLTHNSQTTLTTLVLNDLSRWYTTLPSATLHLTRQFPLDTLEILNYALAPDPLSLLISLPATLKNLSIPKSPAIVPFLGSGACPNLQTFDCERWYPTVAEEEAAEEAVASRGLFVVKDSEWGPKQWEDTSW